MQYLAKRFADGKTRVSKMVADSHLAVYATKRSRWRMELWLRNRLPWGLLRFSTDPLKVMPISTSVDALQFFFHFESPGSPLWLLIARFGRVVFWSHLCMSFFDL